MYSRARIHLTVFGICLATWQLAAQVPGIINYQGRLAVSGTNYTGIAPFKFALVTAGGATTLWSYNGTGTAEGEPANPGLALAVNNGMFSVNLGDVTVSNMTQSIPASIFTNSAVYLRIWVGSGTGSLQLLTPDQRITAVGYAQVAAGVLGTVAGATNFTGSLAGDVTGTQGATVVARVGGLSAAQVAAGASAANSASSANTADTIVKRDANGDFTARNVTVGTATGNFTGNGSGLTNLNAANLSGTLPAAALEGAMPSGLTVVSTSACDTNLAARGYQLITSVPAPAWVNGAGTDAASGRYGHTAVWDGKEWLVWGGDILSTASRVVNSGSIYHPDSDQWEAIAQFNAPEARSGHTAVWDGSGMIVWGGNGSNALLNTGGRFVLTNQSWTATATNGAPAARVGHVALWTGDRMVVWGGRTDSGLLFDGALYSPASNKWTTLSVANPPEARYGAAAVWAGDRLLIWGGVGAGGVLSNGAQLIFTNGAPAQWVAMPAANAPSARRWHAAVWTGQQMIVWGGEDGATPLGDGAAFSPAVNAWVTLAANNTPVARFDSSAAWTGREMLIWGGSNGAMEFASGAAYDPAAAQWRPLSTSGGPLARTQATACWTGSELMVFGGLSAGMPTAALQRLVPQPVWYFYRKL